MKVVWDERMHDAWGLVVSALPDAEVYYANNVPGSTTDPNGNKNDRGYAGMTFEILKAKYESTLKPFTVVRSSSTSYCIEATANGVTVMKNGPAATIVEGRC